MKNITLILQIVNTLLRFYNPECGKILIDGVDIRSLDLKEYRQMISVVSQDLYLFNATLKNNIKLYSKNKEYTLHNIIKNNDA